MKPGQAVAFEDAFATAKKLLVAVHGFRDLELHHSLERPNRYLLIVRWATGDDQVQRFREAAEYRQISEVLQRFYEASPVVERFALVTEMSAHGF